MEFPYLRLRDWMVSRRVFNFGKIDRVVLKSRRIALHRAREVVDGCKGGLKSLFDFRRSGIKAKELAHASRKALQFGDQRIFRIRNLGCQFRAELRDAPGTRSDFLLGKKVFFFTELQTGSFDLANLMREEINFAQCALFIPKHRVLFLCQPHGRASSFCKFFANVLTSRKAIEQVGLMLARK